MRHDDDTEHSRETDNVSWNGAEEYARLIELTNHILVVRKSGLRRGGSGIDSMGRLEMDGYGQS
jgi:hypothetical protein